MSKKTGDFIVIPMKKIHTKRRALSGTKTYLAFEGGMNDVSVCSYCGECVGDEVGDGHVNVLSVYRVTTLGRRTLKHAKKVSNQGEKIGECFI